MPLVTKYRDALRMGTMTALATALCGAMAMPAQARVPGKDGALTVGVANTVVNSYTTLGVGAAAGATTLSVASAAGITVGDVLLVYQAQGATIGTGNTSAYGAVTALGNAGRYEYVSVAAVSGTTITLGTACDTTPLRFSYNSGAQVVRVPVSDTASHSRMPRAAIASGCSSTTPRRASSGCSWTSRRSRRTGRWTCPRS